MTLPRSRFRPIGSSRKQGIIAVLTLAAIAHPSPAAVRRSRRVEIRGFPWTSSP